jgi:hypothetical protein
VIACRAIGGGLVGLLAINPTIAASQDAPTPTPTIGVTPGADVDEGGQELHPNPESDFC